MTLLIKNGKVWAENELRDLSILINEEGIITGLLDAQIDMSELDCEVMDVAGSWVFPGGIDIHAHIQDGAETFCSGTRAAARGGITTVLDMPPFKTTTNRKQCLARREWAERECVTDFGLTGGIVIDREDLFQMNEVAEFGVGQFKVFMLSDPPVDLLWEAVKTAAHTGMRLTVHMEEPALLGKVNWDDPLGFPKANPPVAENVATAKMLEMARAAGAPIHVCHVSSARTAELIDIYKAWGTDVSAETTPHYLLLNEEEFFVQGDRVVATPALRTKTDNELLWQALRDGVIDVVISDHFLGALPDPEKPRPAPQDAEPGIAGLELSLPLLFSKGVKSGEISMKRFVEVTSTAPAKLLGMDARKGRIAAGADADLVILDPLKTWRVKDFGSDSRVSTLPYEGWELQGYVDATLVRGRRIWNGKEIIADCGWGEYIPAKRSH